MIQMIVELTLLSHQSTQAEFTTVKNTTRNIGTNKAIYLNNLDYIENLDLSEDERAYVNSRLKSNFKKLIKVQMDKTNYNLICGA